MRRSAPLTVSLLVTAALAGAGCSDLGTCDDPAKGRTLVQMNGQLYYTGQAIITRSCATGCHAAGATGAIRNGAPADLNFDLNPLAPGDPIMDPSGNVVGVQLNPTELSGLRGRQRKVYDMRTAIWDQVKDGLMPPSNFSMLKSLTGIMRTVIGASGCTGMGELTDLGANRQDLRNWLACDTPVVETSSDDLPYKPLDPNAPPEDKAAGSGYYATAQSVGYQYPACGGGSSGTAPSFSELYTEIFSIQCKICHAPNGVPEAATLDFSTEDIAYMELLGANGMGGATSCTTSPAPFVTPNRPEQSYLLFKVGGQTGTICGSLMPAPPGISKAQSDKIRAWIMAGALRTPAAGGGDGGVAAGDAGAADAAR
jgi:hypothetical protein